VLPPLSDTTDDAFPAGVAVFFRRELAVLRCGDGILDGEMAGKLVEMDCEADVDVGSDVRGLGSSERILAGGRQRLSCPC
jgi:hypothetical protein